MSRTRHRATVTTTLLASLFLAPAAFGAGAPAPPGYDCSPTGNTIFGTAGNDILFGTAGNDLIFGGPGNDRIDRYLR